MRHLLFSVLLSSLLFACTSSDVKIDVKQSQSHYKLALELAQLNLFKNALEESKTEKSKRLMVQIL